MSNFELVDSVFSSVSDKMNANGLSSLLPEERNVYLVWAAAGLLENGSFQYFFENDMDPEATAQSFQELEMFGAAECFRLAASLLPSDYKDADDSRQMEILRLHEPSFDTLARKILTDGEQIEARLANYIALHPALMALARP